MTRFAGSILATEGLLTGLWYPGIVANALGIGISSVGRVGLYPTVRDLLAKATNKEPTPALMFSAGLIAGGFGYLVSSPVYQVKTLAQAEAGLLTNGVLTTGTRAGETARYHGRSLLDALDLLRSEGHLFRGAGALVVRGALLSAGQAMGYDFCKREAPRYLGEHSNGPAMHVVASVAGALSAAIFSTPPDVIMTRFQAGHFPSILTTISGVLKDDGPLGFYRGFWPFFLRLSPVFMLSLPLTEQLRRMAGLGYI